MATSDMCTNCGGQLPPFVPGKTFVQCHFCGHRANVDLPKPVVRERVVIVRQPNAVNPPVKVSGLIWLAIVIPILLATIIPAIIAGTAASKSGTSSDSPFGGGAEDFQWTGDAPFAAKINADATEDIVGHYRVLNSGKDKKTQEFIGGIDGVTLKRIWSAGPYVDGDDSRGFKFAVVGNNVLVTDPKSVGHILDVTTGKETATITMSDRADSICVEPTGKPEAWIHVTDNEDLDVDFTSKRTKKMARPAWCKSSSDINIGDIQCESGQFTKTSAHCSGVDSSFKAPNFEGDKMLSDGTATVVVGKKSPGTGIPTAVGYDPKTKKILWQRPIPQSNATQVSDGLGLTDMADGRLISQIQFSTGLYRLAALDARTGAELWETEIPRSKDGSAADVMLITASRVYLPHWTWLDIFDVKTGKVIGTVGQW
jgi:hypothetical protein